jgi:alpha-tubulin suppressor-like RCC1 family protein
VLPGAATTALAAPAGSVKAWGWNAYGQLGNGTTTTSLIPVGVNGLAGVGAVAAGGAHSLAIKSDGSVVAWGWNTYGQLGNGTTANSATPVVVTGLTSGVVAVAAGENHSLALKSNGSVVAWGFNGYGQLGNGTITNSLTPVAVSGLTSGVAAVTGGQRHSLAVKTNGSVVAWGDNAYGQLGNGLTGSYSATPLAVSGLSSGVTAAAAGSGHSLALKTNGSVVAWGRNDSGQLGDGTTTGSAIPVAVSGLSSAVTAVAAGGAHSLALKSTGSAVAWGGNASGQLGNGTTTNSSVPTAITGLSSGVTAVAASIQAYSLAIKTGGSVVAWGINDSGQLGDGTTPNRSTPVGVSDLGSAALAISAGGFHGLAVFTSSVPTVTSAAPNSRGQGAPHQSITITGTNFVNGAVADFGSGITVHSTSYTNPTRLSADISVTEIAAIGSRTVKVTNPDGSSASCAACFDVGAGPTVTSADPNSLAQATPDQAVVVSGSNFVAGPGLVVSFGNGITVLGLTFIDANTLEAVVTVAGDAAVGPRDVTVTNPDGGRSTCVGCLAVTANSD